MNEVPFQRTVVPVQQKIHHVIENQPTIQTRHRCFQLVWTSTSTATSSFQVACISVPNPTSPGPDPSPSPTRPSPVHLPRFRLSPFHPTWKAHAHHSSPLCIQGSQSTWRFLVLDFFFFPFSFFGHPHFDSRLEESKLWNPVLRSRVIRISLAPSDRPTFSHLFWGFFFLPLPLPGSLFYPAPSSPVCLLQLLVDDLSHPEGSTRKPTLRPTVAQNTICQSAGLFEVRVHCS